MDWGYDSTRDDYIVLRVDNEGDTQDEILTLKSGEYPYQKNVNLFPKQPKWDVTIEMGVSILANMLCVFNNNEKV
ncbi:hypothetical protein H5410_025232 [Solanum commersonii]|uniref:Uncharacterized protein n=1 Tax=Solanum commersonii TaxID=4109 RepID=A0A9J5YXD8_SOLCO|nr:hypothetical protein H5410_025232 [Solanum commersonii]